MSTLLSDAPAPAREDRSKVVSLKREQHISLGGKTRIRVDADTQRRFVSFCSQFCFTRHLDALILLLRFALIVIEVFGPVVFLIVRNRAERGEL
jgi:hypothetical protein